MSCQAPYCDLLSALLFSAPITFFISARNVFTDVVVKVVVTKEIKYGLTGLNYKIIFAFSDFCHVLAQKERHPRHAR